MNKIFTAAILGSALLLSACGRPIDHNGKHYPTYGLLNADTNKSKDMCYEISTGNLIWGIIGFENVIMPVYFFGFSLYNPKVPNPDGSCGID